MNLKTAIKVSFRLWGYDIALTMSLFLLFFKVSSNFLVYSMIILPTIIASLIVSKNYLRQKYKKSKNLLLIIIFLFSGIIPLLFYRVLFKSIISLETITIKIIIATLFPIILNLFKIK